MGRPEWNCLGFRLPILDKCMWYRNKNQTSRNVTVWPLRELFRVFSKMFYSHKALNFTSQFWPHTAVYVYTCTAKRESRLEGFTTGWQKTYGMTIILCQHFWLSYSAFRYWYEYNYMVILINWLFAKVWILRKTNYFPFLVQLFGILSHQCSSTLHLFCFLTIFILASLMSLM